MMKGTFPSVRYTAVDNLYSGPYSGRKATKAAYVEFASAEAATDFFKEVKSNHSSKLSIGGKELDVKPARTKLNGQRNYSIRQAHDLIKSHPQANNKEVEFDLAAAPDQGQQLCSLHAGQVRHRRHLQATILGPLSGIGGTGRSSRFTPLSQIRFNKRFRPPLRG
jgi:hypothetical protein